MGELQRANMWKRISAAFFDVVMTAIVVVGMALLLSFLLGYDGYLNDLETLQVQYEQEFGVSFDISSEEFDKLTEAEQTHFGEAYRAFATDKEVLRTNGLLLNLAMLIVTFSLLFAMLIWELIIPLILRNGQTLGKKLFGLAVVREDAVRVTPFQMTVRAVLGKFTVESMLPVYILIMYAFGVMGIVGPAVLLLLVVGEIILLAVTRNRTPIHDMFARTAVVDYASQRIFASTEEKDAYYLRLHKEMVDQSDY